MNKHSIPEAVKSRETLMLGLYDVSEAVRSALLEAIDAETLKILVETALNVILDEIPSDEQQLKELSQHRKELLILSRANTSQKERRRLLAKTKLYRSIFDIALPTISRGSL